MTLFKVSRPSLQSIIGAECRVYQEGTFYILHRKLCHIMEVRL